MLSKLVINGWVHVSSGLVLKDRGRMVKRHIPVWGCEGGRGKRGGSLLGSMFKCGKIG